MRGNHGIMLWILTPGLGERRSRCCAADTCARFRSLRFSPVDGMLANPERPGGHFVSDAFTRCVFITTGGGASSTCSGELMRGFALHVQDAMLILKEVLWVCEGCYLF